MEWLGLMLWVLAVGLAVPISALGGLTSPSLGTQSLLAVAGLVFCVLYLALDGGRWMAWTSFGLALAAAALVAKGAQVLLSDEPRTASAGAAAEENAAGLAGVAFPLLLTVAFTMICAALGATTVG
jgi:hypothetical protein